MTQLPYCKGVKHCLHPGSSPWSRMIWPVGLGSTPLTECNVQNQSGLQAEPGTMGAARGKGALSGSCTACSFHTGPTLYAGSVASLDQAVLELAHRSLLQSLCCHVTHNVELAPWVLPMVQEASMGYTLDWPCTLTLAYPNLVCRAAQRFLAPLPYCKYQCNMILILKAVTWDTSIFPFCSLSTRPKVSQPSCLIKDYLCNFSYNKVIF